MGAAGVGFFTRPLRGGSAHMERSEMWGGAVARSQRIFCHTWNDRRSNQQSMR